MARNRKNRAGATTGGKSSAVDISEEEQWRIINESGILKQVPRDQKPQIPIPDAQLSEEEEEEGLSPFAEEVFNAMMLIIPMSFMLLMMEILVHYQYGRKPDTRDLLDRMLPGVPIISVFIFYSNRYKQDRRVQSALFCLSLGAGARLAWLMNRGNWLVVMRQSPPLATAWIYAVVQLNLLPAIVSLAIVAAYSWHKGLKLIP
ncbi:hypothetical protein C8Q74DRAFT_1368392 [Fomes fomentarius]|nr:hypothetical protein C8Q74DRAFT_1368392 [Fomes fomentarius]